MYLFLGCESNKKLYTEIGCKPIYSNDSSSCPVAYDCGKLLREYHIFNTVVIEMFDVLQKPFFRDRTTSAILREMFTSHRPDFLKQTRS